MKRSVAAIFAAFITTAAASAQSYPGDLGLGIQRGMEQQTNSGQVGTVTLFQRGPNTAVVVDVHGAPPGRVEPVRIYRGQDCGQLASLPVYVLADMRGGRSRSIVRANQEKLLSGNYNVGVFSSSAPGARPVSCGHLYH
jgi:hypothetical protein